MPKSRIIQVYEHDILRVQTPVDNSNISKPELEQLEKFYGDGQPYFGMVRNGVKFNQFVGVLKVGNLTIHVLPKIDRNGADEKDKDKWEAVLIDMLRAVGLLKIHAPSSASLRLKSNSILDLYFELFINETERLLHKGLVKRYRKTEGNQKVLKGSLNFGKHVTNNLVHAERFYVNYTTYDVAHQLNRILLKTLHTINLVSNNVLLTGRVNRLLLDFPELEDIKVYDSTFERLTFNRKTEDYRTAIDIAKLILLNYHPDVRQGKQDILALMFDMNKLWEAYAYKQINRFKLDGWQVIPQTRLAFWESEVKTKIVKPDIVLTNGHEVICVDTKWKLPPDLLPSDDDLKQMFVYNQLLQHRYPSGDIPHSILLYPSNTFAELQGHYLPLIQYGKCSSWSFCILQNSLLDKEAFQLFWKELDKERGKEQN